MNLRRMAMGAIVSVLTLLICTRRFNVMAIVSGGAILRLDFLFSEGLMVRPTWISRVIPAAAILRGTTLRPTVSG
jgi:hypothetical protein